METLRFPFPGTTLSISNPSNLPQLPWLSSSSSSPPPQSPRQRRSINRKVAIRPPPPGFDYKSAVLDDTRSAAAAGHPELMGLVEGGALALVEKRRFGPVPSWRREFVEPDAIWLVGTHHLSRQSSADVERVVRALRPDNVVVELCRSRAGIMYASTDAQDAPLLGSNMFSLTGANFFGAVNRSINLGGQSALALRLLLAVFSSKISSGANQSFGDEFRAARKVSEEIGAQLVLGDRPIEITLERAWKSLKWNEKLRLIISLFRGITSPSIGVPESNVEYLAWSLKRSKAVNNGKIVVGVIGKGHMNGVVHALISDQGDLRFRDLVGRASGESSDGWISGAIKGLVRDTVIGLVIWVLYEQLKTIL
ncbi:uncharacterized protein LOC109728551 isoform X2 [Ananas comosus]|uniref:Uncharacterized protein LOC109728551 isoform X2 n=1 Tax=Ananas comosus TaxID=4615 RepID=A0A6P5H0V4_ANACO|nr:uncharacterized protein LOC109728551 isoform X2 [Ananas comosus]